MYLWIKAFHLISMVAWFAGLFYIFRLFVYHAKFKAEPKMCEVYSLMEKKLLFFIMRPSFLLTVLFGCWMLYLNPVFLEQSWLHYKLLGVAVLVGYHMYSILVYKRFSRGDFFISEKACRIINEIPAVLLIIIVLLVVLKP